MNTYHRTTPASADAILCGGFKDATGRYMTTDVHSGVWVTADEPWDLAIGGFEADSALLVIEVPGAVFTEHEWVQDVGYREALVPAEVLNRYPMYRAIECDECSAVARENAPGWTRETVSAVRGPWNWSGARLAARASTIQPKEAPHEAIQLLVQMGGGQGGTRLGCS